MLKIIKDAWQHSEPLVKRRAPWLLAGFSVLTLLETFGIASVFPLLLILVSPEESLQNPIIAHMVRVAEIDDVLVMAKYLVSIAIVILIVKNISSILLYRWNNQFLQTAIKLCSNDLFSRYVRMPYLSSLKRDVSQLTTAIVSFPGSLYSTVYSNVIAVLVEGFTICVLLSLLIIANPIATAVAISVMMVSGLGVYIFSARKLRTISHISREAIEEKFRQINDTFKSFKEMRVAGRGGRFLEKFQTQTEILASTSVKQATYMLSTRYIIEIGMLISLSVYLAITFTGNDVATSVGHIGLFGAVAMRLMPSIARIVVAMQNMQTATSYLTKLMQEKTELNDNNLEDLSSLDTRAIVNNRVSLNLEFDQVTFAYHDTSEIAVKDVSFVIPFGESIGIVGASGAGKTTIADMMLGVLEPTSGTIRANDKNIYDDIYSWRDNVAYVPQDIAFISGTLKNNIVFGLNESEIDIAHLNKVVEEAHLVSVVSKLSDGLDTYIGEGGRFLSGGERQRVGIARALYQNASVLVLDEATSALDVETETRLTESIHDLRGKCTTVIIAHRLKTIQKCDKIVYMSAGKIVAYDTFDNLIKSDTDFAHLVELSRIQETLEEQQVRN